MFYLICAYTAKKLAQPRRKIAQTRLHRLHVFPSLMYSSLWTVHITCMCIKQWFTSNSLHLHKYVFVSCPVSSMYVLSGISGYKQLSSKRTRKKTQQSSIHNPAVSHYTTRLLPRLSGLKTFEKDIQRGRSDSSPRWKLTSGVMIQLLNIDTRNSADVFKRGKDAYVSVDP